MKPRSMLREALRDIATGTAWTRGLAISAVIVIVLSATADLAAINRLTSQAREFNRSGASTWILTSEGKVDAKRCDHLTGVPGVRASGAIRAMSGTIKPVVIPGAPLPVYEASPGFIAVIGAKPQGFGVLIGPEASDALGIHGPGTIATASARVPVAGTYAYPNDGRRPGFSYAAVAPSGSDSPFDECWVDTWPVKDVTTALLSTVRVSGALPEEPALSQLNTTHGKSFNGGELFAGRMTRFSGTFTAVAGCVLGLVSVRLRRLSLASALHAGVSRRALFGIITFETLAWSAFSVALGLPLVMLIAGGDALTVLPGVWSTLPIVPAAFAGAWIGVLTVKEDHLFKYFKSR